MDEDGNRKYKSPPGTKAPPNISISDRAKMQAAGRRKLEEFRMRRAATVNGSKPRRPLPGPVSGDVTPVKSDATSNALPTLDKPNGDSPLRQTRSAEVPPSAGLGTGMPEDDPADAMVQVLMQQVANLMKEKAALVEKNNQLERDNEALQELVGFLSGEFEGDPDDFGQYGDVGEDGGPAGY